MSLVRQEVLQLYLSAPAFVFLQIEIDVNNSGNFINMGVVQLLSVPYALYSNSAASSNYSSNSGSAQTSVGSGVHFF